jgi:hypothetical protein
MNTTPSKLESMMDSGWHCFSATITAPSRRGSKARRGVTVVTFRRSGCIKTSEDKTSAPTSSRQRNRKRVPVAATRSSWGRAVFKPPVPDASCKRKSREALLAKGAPILATRWSRGLTAPAPLREKSNWRSPAGWSSMRSSGGAGAFCQDRQCCSSRRREHPSAVACRPAHGIARHW